MKTEGKETEFSRDFLREDKEDHEEANDVKKKEKQTSFASDTVERQAEEKLRDCECLIDDNEANKCEKDEILKREVCESIADVKNKDSAQKNKRKTKKNDGELDDCNEGAKICDGDNNESNKRMNLDNETTDLNDYFLDSGQVKAEEEDGTSGFR